MFSVGVVLRLRLRVCCVRCYCRRSTRCARSGSGRAAGIQPAVSLVAGLGMDDAVDHAVFSKNRDRLLTSDLAQRFSAEVNRLAKRFMSDDHFTFGGTLIQGWPAQKSFRRKDGSDDGDGANFHGQKG